MKLYGTRMSGNCWKAAQILALTGHAFDWIDTDSSAGETRTPDFLALNPVGKVPTLMLDEGTVLIESNAILLHFAEGTPRLPPPGLDRTGCMNGCSSSNTATRLPSRSLGTSSRGGVRRTCTPNGSRHARVAERRRWM